ncbi:MAG TPA: glucokinase [Chlamydiales bacterium]|nr:glucokinase [Chlamydiales bacterium]
MILAGDIGGTNTRLALFEKGKRVSQERKFPSHKYKGLEEIVAEFLQTEKGKVERACFGVAGPVRNGVCKTTNIPWIIDAAKLAKAVHIPSVHLLNDLEANAYGLQVLQPEDLYLLNPGEKQKGNRALIAAGTGLGEAGLFWDGKTHHPFACEGGHADFGPRNEAEIELFLYLKKKFGHVSCERVVSGPGLHSIFQFLVDTGKETLSREVKEEMEKRDPSKVISDWGSRGKDGACVRAVDWFVSMYGAEAGNLALKFLSLGGFYVGGGIAPHIVEKMKQGTFLSSFADKGRFHQLLLSIPIWIVLNDNAALLGAAFYADKKKGPVFTGP